VKSITQVSLVGINQLITQSSVQIQWQPNCKVVGLALGLLLDGHESACITYVVKVIHPIYLRVGRCDKLNVFLTCIANIAAHPSDEKLESEFESVEEPGLKSSSADDIILKHPAKCNNLYTHIVHKYCAQLVLYRPVV